MNALIKYINDYRDEMLSKKLANRLDEISIDEWLSIGHKFNSWEFPLKFYDLIPKWWGYGKNAKRCLKVMELLFNKINLKFDNKEQLRFHNVCCGHMTDEEFEYWYSIERVYDGKSLSTYYNRYCKIKELKWWENEVFEKIVSLGVIKNCTE